MAQEQHSNTPTLERRIEEQLLEDWLDEPPILCAFGGDPYEEDDCPAPATWSARFRCGHCWTFCDEHQQVMAHDGREAVCPCDKVTKPERIIWSRL